MFVYLDDHDVAFMLPRHIVGRGEVMLEYLYRVSLCFFETESASKGNAVSSMLMINIGKILNIPFDG